MTRTASELRELAERHRREQAEAEEQAAANPEVADLYNTQADFARQLAEIADREADQLDSANRAEQARQEGDGLHGDDPEAPADNPAEQIGDAAAEVEEAAADAAEAALEAGEPEVAEAIELDALGHLEAAVAALRGAQENVEAVADAEVVSTEEGSPEGEAAEEAAEQADVADEAVDEAEEAVAEVARDVVSPSSEHPYFRERSIFRRNRS